MDNNVVTIEFNESNNVAVLQVSLKEYNPREDVPKATFGINDAIAAARQKYGQKLAEPLVALESTTLDNRPQPGRRNLFGTFRFEMKPRTVKQRRTSKTTRSRKTKNNTTE